MKNAYLISYDLRKPGRNYEPLYEAIKRLSGSWCHALESVWVVKHSGPAEAIRNSLTPHMDSNDAICVLRLQGEGAWRGLDAKISDWLKANLS
jgi:hypothetical protein